MIADHCLIRFCMYGLKVFLLTQIPFTGYEYLKPPTALGLYDDRHCVSVNMTGGSALEM